MGFSISSRNLPRVATYWAADGLFKRTDQPRGMAWRPHQRPLDDSRKQHLRIEQYDGGDSYGLVLYDTIMGKFWRPSEKGDYQSAYQYHDSVSSKTFLYHVLGVQQCNNPVTMDDGTRAFFPCVSGQDRGGWSVMLHFNAQGRVIRDISWHNPEVVYRAHPDNRAKRDAMRKRLLGHPVFLLAWLAAQQPNTNSWVSAGYGSYEAQEFLRVPDIALEKMSSGFIDRLTAVGRTVYKDGMTLEQFSKKLIIDLMDKAHYGQDTVGTEQPQFPAVG